MIKKKQKQQVNYWDTPFEIAIIDDHKALVYMLFTVLKNQFPQISVKVFHDTKQAKRAFYYDEPDLIFLDINMPYKDGLIFAEMLQEQTMIMPYICFISACHQYEEDIKQLEYPFEHSFMQKPFNFEQIVDIVNKKLSERQGLLAAA